MADRAVDPRFAAHMRDLLAARGMSYRALAARTYHAKSYLQRIGTGQQAPTIEVASRIDKALAAGGELEGYVRGDGDAQSAASRESTDLIALLCDGHVDEAIHTADMGAQLLSIEYLTHPPADVLGRALALRRDAVAALPRARGRHADTVDLVVAVGHLSGVLAYAALDLGDVAGARAHVEAAWQCAEVTDHNGLRAWVRGTQSLICRFAGDFRSALTHAEDGVRYTHGGASMARLLCGQAQSHANMGHGREARRALSAAADVHWRGADPDPGLFGFTSAKLAYYSGSALIWLDRHADAVQAETESLRAIAAWKQAPARHRPLGDHSLVQVYLATARLQLHQIEGAVSALEPIFAIPGDRQVSWIKKRLGRIGEIVSGPPYARDPVALELRDRIRAF